MDSKNPDSTAQSERPENKVRGTPSKPKAEKVDKCPKNLHPVRTKEEARERGRAGGKVSGIVRRQKMDLRQDLLAILALPVRDGPVYDVKDAKQLGDLKAQNLTAYQLTLCQLVRKASSGDTKAAKLILDGSGLSLPTQQEVTVTGSLAGYTDEQIAEALDAISGKKPKRA